jgi:hypothetical protein
MKLPDFIIQSVYNETPGIIDILKIAAYILDYLTGHRCGAPTVLT